MSKKKKIIIVIVVVVLFVLIGIGCFAMMRYIDELKQKQDSAGLKRQSNVVMEDTDIEDNSEKVSSINVNIMKNISIKKNDNGKYTLTLGLHNGNEHQYMFIMSVDNQEIYRSDLIPAGASLSEVELEDVALESGTYSAVIIFSVISEKDNATVMGSTGIELTLDVTK